MRVEKEEATIIRTVHDKGDPYARINRKIADDTTLSLAAKGLMLTLLSKPDNWRVYLSDIVNRSNDGYGRIKTAFENLIDSGYVKRRRVQRDWVTLVYESPRKGRGDEAVHRQEPLEKPTPFLDLFPESFQTHAGFISAWKAFMEYRAKTLRNTVTKNKAMNLIAKAHVPDFTADEIERALRDSIDKNWIGFFPRKQSQDQPIKEPTSLDLAVSESIKNIFTSKSVPCKEKDRMVFAQSLTAYWLQHKKTLIEEFPSLTNFVVCYLTWLESRRMFGPHKVGSKPWGYWCEHLQKNYRIVI